MVDTQNLESNESDELLLLIKEANEAGYLKILKTDGSKCFFRVHCSLAAAYGFSYRGAYYISRLSFKDLSKLTNTEDNVEHEKVVKRIAQSLSGESGELPSQLSLFGRK